MILPMAGEVLVVDDDPMFLSLARRMLMDAGVPVAGTAATVAEGLAAARELEPVAVLVDVELPDGNGIDLARELAALPWRPRIVLTSTDRDAVSGPEADGTATFVPKEDLPNAPLRRLLLAD
jgi:DNA-binding NarL/FixJ family response regulator